MNPTVEGALNSPFMEPFKGTDTDVLILTQNIDEMLFTRNLDYKGKKFVSIESNFDEI